MAIDLLGLEPKKISKNLKGKFILLYSKPKLGKTTFAASAPKSLIFSFEPGTNGLAEVYSQKIITWTEFKTAIKQLSNPKVQDKYDTVAIDTVDIAYELCEQYICAQNGVDKIGDIPWGAGYSMLAKEFARAFRTIAMLDYGLIFISHSTEKTLKDRNGVEYVQIQPACPTKAKDIVNKLVDFIIYAGQEYTKEHPEGIRKMYLRETKEIQAGSRFQYVPDVIDFSYDSLVKAVNEAVDKQVGTVKSALTEEKDSFYEQIVSRPFDDAMNEARAIWNDILDKEPENDLVAAKMNDIVASNFGQRIKLSSVTEKQQEILESTIIDLKEYFKSL